MKRLITITILSLATFTLAATPTVTDVTAKQRYPWNGLVDITCKVSGIDGTTNGLKFAVAAVMPDSGNVRRVSKFWVVQNGTNSVDREVHTNGNYRLLWDAQAELGQVVYSNMVTRLNLKEHKKVKVQLWEGGPYWAETNVGAEEPWEYGYYFWWGDTIGYTYENATWKASDGSSSNFSFSESNTPTYGKDTATLQSEGWITTDNVLAPDHDAAHVQWGGNWRMPTKQEFDDLRSKCDWNWTTTNGVNGWVIRGRDHYASNSIFLPCAGYGYETSLYSAGSDGSYWSSVPYSSNYDYYYLHAWYLYFESGYHGTYSYIRYYGRSVRPVQGFTE